MRRGTPESVVWTNGDAQKTVLGILRESVGRVVTRASLLVGDDENESNIEDAHYLYGTCLVEASLMEHEFGVDDSARYLLKRAKDALGITIEKSGALGYRTVHQQNAKAQLVLRVT